MKNSIILLAVSHCIAAEPIKLWKKQEIPMLNTSQFIANQLVFNHQIPIWNKKQFSVVNSPSDIELLQYEKVPKPIFVQPDIKNEVKPTINDTKKQQNKTEVIKPIPGKSTTKQTIISSTIKSTVKTKLPISKTTTNRVQTSRSSGADAWESYTGDETNRDMRTSIGIMPTTWRINLRSQPMYEQLADEGDQWQDYMQYFNRMRNTVGNYIGKARYPNEFYDPYSGNANNLQTQASKYWLRDQYEDNMV